MKKTANVQQSTEVIKKVSAYSTFALIATLLIFLLVTMYGMYKLNSQIKLTTEHPFVVSRDVGEVRSEVAQMRVRTERLQSYNQPADIQRVRQALDELYKKVTPPLDEIKLLYLGPVADAYLLYDTCLLIEQYQQELLTYAAVPGRTKEEITTFEENLLYPLYEQVDEVAATILAFTKNTQMTVYRSSDNLWKTTFIWAIVIVMGTIAGLILFRTVLNRLTKEIYDKNQQFDALSRTIDETFLIFNDEGIRCDFVGENARRVLGIQAAELRLNRKLIYQNVSEETGAEIRTKISDKEESYPREVLVQYQHPQLRETRWLLITIYKTSDAVSPKNILTFADQTEAVRARHTLQDALVNANNANNAKRDFLSRMSHEIRTPMNVIIGMTTIAAASIENRTRIEDCLTKISYSSKHLLMLINDVLDMSRIESSKLAINNEPFDIYQFVNSLVSIVYSQAQCKGIVFREKIIGFEDSTAYIGDSLRLNQILLNLTSNAIKFTGHQGTVLLEVRRISSRDGKERIRFTVTDTGIGMDEDALCRIYNPFDQADETIAQRFGGTGLGMSITKNLVSLMGGYIDVKSKPGEGTVCMVEIPLERGHSIELEPLPAEEWKALNVLVVDDEQDMCEHTAILLTKINIRAKWVLTGQEAIDCVVAAQEAGDGYDICFIDWNMPIMDGVETTRRIRQRIGPDTPIIIISAYDWSEIEQEARRAGANAFISKPLFLSSIYNTLVSVTNGSFARAAAQKVEPILCTMEKKHILVAEDNDLNLEIIEEIIKMHGATVQGARNGQEAVDLFTTSAQGEFDAILMDIQMPIMNGYEATQRIRKLARPDAKRIPIIATTANAFTEDVSAARAAGMDAHVSKPIDMQKLCDVLAKLTTGQSKE